ncbi:hypothetical protein SPSIL_053400 [Sporomusa silvacetica DSM 10669]|uniref:Uncharacterized protein n=1 Tax=Sporomusa silvacetica DSM 10669 TaxID=1123289 RepID=A0ABZ3IU09_9FIRM|nr:hypothetical protein SPSIL_19990 [Sporomusa silvacetica DSM 10669]
MSPALRIFHWLSPEGKRYCNYRSLPLERIVKGGCLILFLRQPPFTRIVIECLLAAKTIEASTELEENIRK